MPEASFFASFLADSWLLDKELEEVGCWAGHWLFIGVHHIPFTGSHSAHRVFHYVL